MAPATRPLANKPAGHRPERRPPAPLADVLRPAPLADVLRPAPYPLPGGWAELPTAEAAARLACALLPVPRPSETYTHGAAGRYLAAVLAYGTRRAPAEGVGPWGRPSGFHTRTRAPTAPPPKKGPPGVSAPGRAWAGAAT